MKLEHVSKIVVIDMGTSMHFHFKQGSLAPTVSLIDKFEKFGLTFDHIYGFEQSQMDEAPAVFKNFIQMKHSASYHWINVGE